MQLSQIMPKQYSAISWRPVALHGAILEGGCDDLIGIEECADYTVDNRRNIKRKLDGTKSPEKSKSSQKCKKRKTTKVNSKTDCSIIPLFSPSKSGSTSHENLKIDIQDSSTVAWKEYDLSEVLMRGIIEQGFDYPTQIQAQTLPPAILGKKDILGAAETGSGKTLAFGLPILNSIMKLKEDNGDSKHPLYALILTPTRELAIQIKGHLDKVAKYSGISIAVVVGGMASVKQERILNKNPEIIVATPGRLWELIQLGQDHLLQIDKIRFLVIDETDRMLERGHFQELQNLLEKINENEEAKKLRQNFVFSATLTLVHSLPKYLLNKKGRSKKIHEITPEEKLKKIKDTIGMTNPKIVDITQSSGLSYTLTESRVDCSMDEKDYYVYYFLKKHPGRTIIFCNSIGCVKRLASLLGLLQCNPLPLHASMQQRQRLKNLDRFKDEENSILVATDVAARGLDIPSVEHVLHYQIPRTSETYIHRSGRTARANKQGLTLLLLDSSEVRNYLQVCKTLNKSEDIPVYPVERRLLDGVKQRVNLARELDKLQLHVKKVNSEMSWFKKTAEEIDMIMDHMSPEDEPEERSKFRKTADLRRKQLLDLLKKPIFHPSLPQDLTSVDLQYVKDDVNAVDVLKNSLKEKKKRTLSLFKPKRNVKIT